MSKWTNTIGSLSTVAAINHHRDAVVGLQNCLLDLAKDNNELLHYLNNIMKNAWIGEKLHADPRTSLDASGQLRARKQWVDEYAQAYDSQTAVQFAEPWLKRDTILLLAEALGSDLHQLGPKEKAFANALEIYEQAHADVQAATRISHSFSGGIA